jgi:uncharacterized repeat protein (TIGR03803 family)
LNFYGTTTEGGAYGKGTVFQFNPNGTLTTLYSFCPESSCTDGAVPEAGLIQATDGNLYGTTWAGGAFGGGTVFEITPGGTPSTAATLYSFCAQSGCPDGVAPTAGLIQAANGDLYGTTSGGGAYGNGTAFHITPTVGAGSFRTLYSFCGYSGCPYGQTVGDGLVQGTDGNFYGTTLYGGAGTIFSIAPTGALTTLYDFCSQSGCTDGYYPEAPLVQATNGSFYGTALAGGNTSACSGGCGTVFMLSVGLGPFVETQSGSGAVGAAVAILGNNLAGATSVTFNGTAAVFTVNPTGTAISTTVPASATTGTVQVVTASGTKLSSNVPFQVLP